jgi:tyrosyl-tRNA synthetase
VTDERAKVDILKEAIVVQVGRRKFARIKPENVSVEVKK